MKINWRRTYVIVIIVSAPLLVLFLQLSLVRGMTNLIRITPPVDDLIQDSYYPSVSADGTKIAFSSMLQTMGYDPPGEIYEIWLYDTNTMTYTRITSASDISRDSLDPSLDVTGTKIAFYSDSDFLKQNVDSSGEIWLYDTNTMTYTRVTTASSSDRTSMWPSLSGDGTRIAFGSDSDFLGHSDIQLNENEIWLYDTNTMTYTRITTGTTGSGNQYPSLSSDGTKIAFVRSYDQIWMYDTVAMTLTHIAGGTSPICTANWPHINADGTRIVFEGECSFVYDIWLYDTATMTFTRVTSASDASRNSYRPQISADGTKIVFESDLDILGEGVPDDQQEIWLYDITTMNYTRVTTATPSGRQSYNSILSADGTRIVFQSFADFLNENIPNTHQALWTVEMSTIDKVYLPIVFKD